MPVGVGPNGAAGAIVATAETPVPRGFWQRVLLALTSGLALSAAFPSVDAGALAWAALVPLLLAIRARRPRTAFLLGWVTGFVFFAATCWWIVYTIGHFTNLPVPIAAVLLVLMSAVLGLYHGAWAAGLRWLEERRLPALWLAPAWWVTLEWLRGWFFIGFPWAGLGYTQHRWTDLIQMAEVTGVYGVSAVLVLFNVVAARVLLARGAGARRLLPGLVAVTLLMIALPALGHWRRMALEGRPPAGRITVGLAQGNVAQDQKWDPAFVDETMQRYRELTLAAAAEHPALIAWPETATPFFFQQPGYWRDEMLDVAHAAGTPILFGSPAVRQTAGGEIEQLNRAYLLAPDGRELGDYDKMQLVPFGEYVPFAHLLFFVHQLVHAVGQLGAGLVPTVFTLPEGRFGALICYEGIFPGLVRQFVERGANFLVNITNDAWYGRTGAPAQHLIQAQFRTVENRVPMVRAANTGISAVIDADGRVRWQGPIFETLWHVDTVDWPGVRTFYTAYGDVFVWACVAAVAAAIVVGVLRGVPEP